MRKQAVISLADWKVISITCAHCATRVALNMKNVPQLPADIDSFAPVKCPGCTRDYDSAIVNNVNNLQKAYIGMDRFAGQISFITELADQEI